MKRSSKWLIVNFPIIIVFLQVVANFLYAIYEPLYSKLFFFISGLCGMNWVTALFMVAFTFYFRFCRISRVCALAELVFCTADLIVNGNPEYNSYIQLLVGTGALVITYILLKSGKD